MLHDICENSVIHVVLTCMSSLVRQYTRTTNRSSFRMISSDMCTVHSPCARIRHDQWLPRCRSNIGIGNVIVGSFLLLLNSMALYAIWNMLCNLISE